MAQPERPQSGVEDYPFDPGARAEGLRDLDRLRGIADRQLAAYLFALFNSAVANSIEVVPIATQTSSTQSLRILAHGALRGELGAEACELAQALILDSEGRERCDESSLLAFRRALRQLRVSK
jgi:hypothetical protein